MSSDKDIAIHVENLSKIYRLGTIGTGTLSYDLNVYWHKLRGKGNPYARVGEENNREQLGDSDYVWALRDINFEVKKGEILGIIGKNGAGKSTLLKILSRITGPTEGGVHVNGRMASLLEVGTGFHSELTGRENIYLNGAIMGMTKREITSKLEEIVDFSGCARYIDTPIKRYSSGMTVRLGFAVAAFLEPEILIVDEVLAVGDAEFQKKAIGKMQEVSKGEGRTVIFVSHNMDTINNLCSTAIVLDSGALKFSGNTKLAIEFYGNKSKAIINNNFTSNYEPYQSSLYFKEIKVYQDQMIDFSFSTNDPLVFELTLISMISLNNFRIGIRIVNQYDLPVGLFYTDELLSINKFQKQKIRIELKNHNISKGIYFVDFSVGTGNEQNYPLDFFVMEKVISFEISKLFSNSDLIIPTWNEKNWGNINFRDYETKIIENETF